MSLQAYRRPKQFAYSFFPIMLVLMQPQDAVVVDSGSGAVKWTKRHDFALGSNRGTVGNQEGLYCICVKRQP